MAKDIGADNSDNTGKVGKGRPPKDKQFKPGQSGNPKGRPPKLPAIGKLLESVLGEEKNGTTEAEAILMALKAKAKKGDVRAAEILLDRAYGKSKQFVDMTSNGETITPPTLIGLDAADLNKLLELKKKSGR